MAKATGVPVAMVAARVMVGATLAELRAEGLLPADAGRPGHVWVKEAVLPFNRFPGVDTLLGPEMRSTGEVMGIGATFGLAFAKSQMAAGNRLPAGGHRLPVAGRPGQGGRAGGGPPVRRRSGFALAATSGTAGYPRARRPRRHGGGQGGRAHGPGVVDAVELIAAGKVQLVVNTPRGRGPRADGVHIRAAALAHQVPCLTTVAAARAAAAGIADWISHPLVGALPPGVPRSR